MNELHKRFFLCLVIFIAFSVIFLANSCFSENTAGNSEKKKLRFHFNINYFFLLRITWKIPTKIRENTINSVAAGAEP